MTARADKGKFLAPVFWSCILKLAKMCEVGNQRGKQIMSRSATLALVLTALAACPNISLAQGNPFESLLKKGLETVIEKGLEQQQQQQNTQMMNNNPNAVRLVQQRLNSLGYSAGQENGVFGSETRGAILSFEIDQGMDPKGNVTQNVIEATSRALANTNASAATETTAAPNPTQTAVTTAPQVTQSSNTTNTQQADPPADEPFDFSATVTINSENACKNWEQAVRVHYQFALDYGRWKAANNTRIAPMFPLGYSELQVALSKSGISKFYQLINGPSVKVHNLGAASWDSSRDGSQYTGTSKNELIQKWINSLSDLTKGLPVAFTECVPNSRRLELRDEFISALPG